MTDQNDTYLVWSNEHRGWWGPGRRGYVADIKDAGRYSRREALDICSNAMPGRPANEPPFEIPVRAADMESVYGDHGLQIGKEKGPMRP